MYTNSWFDLENEELYKVFFSNKGNVKNKFNIDTTVTSVKNLKKLKEK